MIEGLTLPFLSAADPEAGGEGSIDPLGLAPLADRLADQIAPGITARMSRIRYLTAISVASRILEPYLDERMASDGSPPFLVLEWMIVEAFARTGGDLPGDARQIPGIDKARASVIRGEPMCARNYLKTPKVFGFHGVYKTLAQALLLVDRDGAPCEAGERLARVWERELDLAGFLDGSATTPGGRLRRRIDEALDRSMAKAQNELPRTSSFQAELVRMFRPDGAGKSEKLELRNLLFSENEPLRHETLGHLQRLNRDTSEFDCLTSILPSASPALAIRLRSIACFEAFAMLLYALFHRLTYLSSDRGTKPLTPADLASDSPFRRFANDLPAAARVAHQALDDLGDPEPLALFESRFAQFESEAPAEALFGSILAHHEQTQSRKPPRGKRPWFERDGQGVVVRLPYRRWEPMEPGDYFVHPYRFSAMLRFLEDLR